MWLSAILAYAICIAAESAGPVEAKPNLVARALQKANTYSKLVVPASFSGPATLILSLSRSFVL